MELLKIFGKVKQNVFGPLWNPLDPKMLQEHSRWTRHFFCIMEYTTSHLKKKKNTPSDWKNTGSIKVPYEKKTQHVDSRYHLLPLLLLSNP